MSVDFAFVPGVFYALDHVGLERVPFFEEFIDTLRLGPGYVGQSL